MKRFISKRTVYFLLLIFFGLVFLASGCAIVDYFANDAKEESNYNSLVDQIITAPPTIAQDPTQDAAEPDQPTLPTTPQQNPAELVDVTLADGTTEQVMLKYSLIYPQNSDMVGWLSIPGTEISYPVMHTPDDPEYYLNHNFYKETSAHGCLFIQASCNVFKPSDNVTIYGHHMRTGAMFGDLIDYRDKSFWQEHRTITFDTIHEEHTYEVMAVFSTTATVGEGFAYHEFDYASNEQEFLDFYYTCKRMSMYDTDVTAEYGDKFITLSTCEYSQDNGRFVVVAKRIS